LVEEQKILLIEEIDLKKKENAIKGA